ncbi:MAG TPA: M42 family peptidase [Anaerolineae bacterium]|nr:M42 family peptidase [Anaerolineae bacterium]
MNRETLVSTLLTLSEIISTSGNETPMRCALRPLLEGHVDDLRVDGLGNLIALKRGTGESALRFLVTAHMDEVGLMVVGYTGEGALRVEPIGGVNSQLLPGLRVLVGSARLPGVIGLRPIHRASAGNFKTVPAVDNLAVDIGAKSREEAEEAAPLGTPVAFATTPRNLGESLMGKSFDDRAGCTILTALLQGERLPFDLHGVFTVQEEVGLRGAQVATYAVDPDGALALECTVADDLPKEDEDVSPTTQLGKGPALTVKDRSYTTPPRLLRHVMLTGEAEGIPYQLKQPGISGTESGIIHTVRAGVPVMTIAVPCRYIHSPIALLRVSDLEHTFQLVQASLRRMTPDVLRP